ncbi:MAG: Panacea domain-containing protein [Prosthecobacter sp.]|nr:Panacea domain-containing protein [Prosthecobacter sp.]
MTPGFKDEKTAQAAALLLQLRGGRMSYMKLIKLLYLADRCALLKWGRPITFDAVVSMKNGPVLSHTLNLIKRKRPSKAWRDAVTPPTGWDVALKPGHDAGTSRLSKAEVDVLKTVFKRYGHLERWELVRQLHELPEWQDPGDSAFPISPEDILRAEGVDEKEITAILEELDSLAHRENVFAMA